MDSPESLIRFLYLYFSALSWSHPFCLPLPFLPHSSLLHGFPFWYLNPLSPPQTNFRLTPSYHSSISFLPVCLPACLALPPPSPSLLSLTVTGVGVKRISQTMRGSKALNDGIEFWQNKFVPLTLSEEWSLRLHIPHDKTAQWTNFTMTVILSKLSCY